MEVLGDQRVPMIRCSFVRLDMRHIGTPLDRSVNGTSQIDAMVGSEPEHQEMDQPEFVPTACQTHDSC